MANNRMYLKCKICQDEMSFAKYYPSESGSGAFIALMTKEDAERNLATYYPKNWKIKKLKVN